ncbi:MAG: thiamine-phosphate kinase [Planctomycetes bacterium]|nr:thiamine-phosphate kinase [Planctomycetota bacterium]MBT4559688.1 thiamine-phosphate kinase [Planctomycetota bacterium]MBT5119295.1 thiamine-phosphate kinase [Planctomycetota bacterium]
MHDIFRNSFRGGKGLSGPGSDCARLKPPSGVATLQTVDQLIEGVHAELGTPWTTLARKLLRRTLSDLAAVGARPWAVSWTIAAPASASQSRLKRMAQAFLAEANAFGCAVVGGDLSQSPHLVLTCTATGLEGRRRAPGRSGARPGDWLLVTGRLGGAVQSGRHLRPEPRLTEGTRLNQTYRPRAMMDLSDGLATDLPRLLRASGVGAQIQLNDLPLHPEATKATGHERWQCALAEGEDYELLIALPARRARMALTDPVLLRTGLTQIGTVTEGNSLVWLDGQTPLRAKFKGWTYSWKS